MLAAIGYGCAVATLVAVPATSAGADTRKTGGASATPPPKLRTLQCRSLCAGVTGVRPGSLVVVRGKDLDTVESVTFVGARRAGDEATVEPEQVSRTWVTVRVPDTARSGPVTVANAEGAYARATRRRVRVKALATRKVPGGLEVAVSGRKVFFGAERKASVTFVAERAGSAVVEVVRPADGAVIARFDQGAVAAGEQREVTWDGMHDGVAAPDGRYEFRVTLTDGQGAVASSSQAAPEAQPSPDSFLLVGHKFPVRGRHDFGGFEASYGGGRGHQGQDVFAKCGTPLVAARGGTVKIKQFHERAGHYVVLDGGQTDVDYVYMHLRDAALVDKGDTVRTGQLIGHVGDTGRAHGCHLHFELWSGPGWYTGGSPFDPLPHLKDWDRFS